MSPGVYIILLGGSEPRLRGNSDIAYIGKATNLKGLRGRVRQYFHPGPTQRTNKAMNQRLCGDACVLRIGFISADSAASARRLESDLLIQFEREHQQLPPYNRQRALDSASRRAGGSAFRQTGRTLMKPTAAARKRAGKPIGF